MIEKLADSILGYARRNGKNFDVNNTDIYRYGIEIFISSAVNIIFALVTGLIFGFFSESVIFMTVFIFTRVFTGGYHAETYFKCNLYFCMLFIFVLALHHYTWRAMGSVSCAGLFLFSVLIIFIFAPVDNPAKTITAAKRKKLHILSVTISLIFGIYGMSRAIFNTSCGTLILYTLTLAAFLILAAKTKLNGGRKNEQI